MNTQGTSFKGYLGTVHIMYVSYEGHNYLMERLMRRGVTKIFSECVIVGKLARVSYVVLN